MSFSHRMASEVVVRNRIRPINVYYPCERVTETRTSDTETRTETGPNPVRGLCARPSRISCGGSTMTRRESDRTKTRAGSLANSKVEDALNAIAASIERMSDEQTPDIPRDRRAIQTVKNHNSQF